MEGGQRANFTATGLIGKPPSPRTRDAVLDAEQSLHRRSAKTYQNVRIGEFDLAADERQADSSFLRRRRAVTRRSPPHDIGDVGGCAIETDRRHHAVEPFAGTTDKTPAANIFVT